MREVWLGKEFSYHMTFRLAACTTADKYCANSPCQLEQQNREIRHRDTHIFVVVIYHPATTMIQQRAHQPIHASPALYTYILTTKFKNKFPSFPILLATFIRKQTAENVYLIRSITRIMAMYC